MDRLLCPDWPQNYEWKENYLAAIREQDPETRRKRVAAAESSILKRLPELMNIPDVVEHQAMREALDALEGIAGMFRFPDGVPLTLGNIMFSAGPSLPISKHVVFANRLEELMASVRLTVAHVFHGALDYRTYLSAFTASSSLAKEIAPLRRKRLRRIRQSLRENACSLSRRLVGRP